MSAQKHTTAVALKKKAVDYSELPELSIELIAMIIQRLPDQDQDDLCYDPFFKKLVHQNALNRFHLGRIIVQRGMRKKGVKYNGHRVKFPKVLNSIQIYHRNLDVLYKNLRQVEYIEACYSDMISNPFLLVRADAMRINKELGCVEYTRFNKNSDEEAD